MALTLRKKMRISNKIHQKCHYCGIFYHYFCNNSGRKLKKNFVKFLGYGNPDILFLGTLDYKLEKWVNLIKFMSNLMIYYISGLLF